MLIIDQKMQVMDQIKAIHRPKKNLIQSSKMQLSTKQMLLIHQKKATHQSKKYKFSPKKMEVSQISAIHSPKKFNQR